MRPWIPGPGPRNPRTDMYGGSGVHAVRRSGRATVPCRRLAADLPLQAADSLLPSLYRLGRLVGPGAAGGRRSGAEPVLFSDFGTSRKPMLIATLDGSGCLG